MSKKPAKSSKFNYTTINPLPKLGKIKTEWDLKKHYYTSEKDPQIEKDLKKTEAAYRRFAARYKKSAFTTNAKLLRKALEELNALSMNPSTARPGRYFSLRTALNSSDETANKRLNQIDERLTKAANEILFFDLELGKIPKQQQRKFLKDPALSNFTYYLKRVFEEAQHDLTEAEERIIRLISGPSYSMWVDATEKMLGKRTVRYKQKDIPLNEAIDYVGVLPFAEKPKLWKLITAELDTLTEVVENEITAICTRKKIGDELRGFKKPYSATVMNYENTEKSVESLIAAVSDIGFKNSQRFYKLKAKLHKVEKLQYAQRGAQIGITPTIPFSDAVAICRDVFYAVDTTYGTIFDTMLTNGQIDVYPKEGKRGGAFMSGESAQPTKVFLNHVNTFGSLTTLAHEMGHAIHTERSKTQPPQYQGYSTTTAETASTLFEGFLFNAVYDQANEKQRTVLLHDKLSRDIATIQRQIAFFNFELEMHTAVREQGAITREELNTMMQKHLRSYMGPAVNVTKEDGHSYVYVSHFRYGFYVYSYAFAILMNSVMAERYKHDHSYLKNIDQLLTSGCSADVATLFKRIGLNTESATTFIKGLEAQTNEINRLSKLTQ